MAFAGRSVPPGRSGVKRVNKDILICGVGGQGTVLASKLIAASAMEEGNPVHSAETIGMAQRGGPVTSHVRVGEGARSPLIPFGGADLILAFEPAEAVRNLKYLRQGGTVVVNTAAVMPVTEALRASGYDGQQMLAYLGRKCECVPVDGEAACRELGSGKFLNVLMLGVAAGSGRLGISLDTLRRVMERSVPQKYLEINRRAFLAGVKIGEEKRQ